MVTLTTTEFLPEIDHGACTLSCSEPFKLSTRYTGAVTPSMVTLTPPTCTGHGAPGAVKTWPAAAPRLEPKMVMIPPGATPVWKLAALVTPALVMVGPWPPEAPAILRTRLLPMSPTYKLPVLSSVIGNGLLNCACRAAPLSPAKPVAPVPAMVEIFPPLTLRIRWLTESTINTVPEESTAMPPGKFRLAAVAEPPSPEKDALPFPATVVMVPLVASMRRIRWFD